LHAQICSKPASNICDSFSPHLTVYDYPALTRLIIQGDPIVVTDVKLQGPWVPHYFIDTFGKKKVTVVDCETNLEHMSTVSEFFHSFGASQEKQRIFKLKVRTGVLSLS
jgi:hypothetical protein